MGDEIPMYPYEEAERLSSEFFDSLTDARIEARVLSQYKDLANHDTWCALNHGRSTCDCDWFEQEGRGLGTGPKGSREVVVPLGSTLMAELLRLAPPMTEEERNEQRASFAYGQLALMSEWSDRSPEDLAKLRQMCRTAAGCKP